MKLTEFLNNSALFGYQDSMFYRYSEAAVFLLISSTVKPAIIAISFM